MAITSGSMKGSPDKHTVPSRAQGPSATGNYDNVAATNVGSSSADDAAANIYGSPGDGTRMSRREGKVQVALEATPNGISGENNESEPFFDGSTLGEATSTQGSEDNANGFSGGSYPQAASVSFPDVSDKPEISAPKAVTAKSNASNHPAVQGSPGFPGLP